TSNISQIERGLSNPSLGALRRLAEVLGVPVFFFFIQEHMDESAMIVRRDQRKTVKIPSSNIPYEVLSPNLNNCSVEIVAVTLAPGEASSNDFFMHTGEEACVVLSGRVTVLLGEAEYEIAEGDCAQFNAQIVHRYINKDPKNEARLLYAITPPSF
ncbi:MAG: helix-turn-helix transcriptional regulator, partial [Deltaproteobacteria bacterium]|nr:helix-turn-helix transcriptional regulator [Deltaproteobacteria bacterium]